MKSGNENRLENSNGYGLAFNEMKGFFMSATPDDFLEMMIVNHKESNMFMLSPDAGRHCLTHANDSFSLSSCTGTGSFVSMQLSFVSEEKETLKHQKRKLFQNGLPSAMPTKQETHLLGNLETIIGGVMTDFEDVWQDVSLVDHPSTAPSSSPSVLASSAPSSNPSEMPSLLPSSGPSTTPSSSLVPSMKPSESPTLSPYPLISVNLNFRLILDLCQYENKDITFGLEQSLKDYLRRNPVPLNGLEVFWIESVTVLNNCTEVRSVDPYVPQNIIYTIVTARVIPGFPSTTPTLKPTTVPTLSMLPSLDPTSAPSGFPTGVPTAKPSSEPSETPTNRPSVTSSPPTTSLQPSLAPTFCTDWYGFEDAYGDDCTWYEERLENANQCPFYGQYWANSDGVSADMACCFW